jgi:hypothetical protein
MAQLLGWVIGCETRRPVHRDGYVPPRPAPTTAASGHPGRFNANSIANKGRNPKLASSIAKDAH